MALLLNIIPHVIAPPDMFHCLVAGPTLMLSLYTMLLYVVDQVQAEAEMYYVVIELVLTIAAFCCLFLQKSYTVTAIYGLFYIDLLIAFSMDIFYQKRERGFNF